MNSSFPDEHHEPDTTDLELALGATFQLWNDLADFTYRMYPKAKPKWKFSGSAGWQFRISDNKRVILYLLPRANFFKAAFVFGQKATDAIVDSNISQEIKTELLTAKKYAEGRGIRIEIRDASKMADIHELIKTKISS